MRQANLYRKSPGGNTRHIITGDVVLLKENEPSVRNEWRMGRVMDLVKGKDGQIRGAKVKVLSKKNGKQTVVLRPLQRLIPFEIVSSNESKDPTETRESELVVQEYTEKTDYPVTTSVSKRPVRKAAIDGQNERRFRERFT